MPPLALAAATALVSSRQEREDPEGTASRIRQVWKKVAGEHSSL